MRRDVLFLVNPDLAVILGRTYSESANFYFGDFLDFQGRPEIWPGPGLGGAWAKSLGEPGPGAFFPWWANGPYSPGL